MLMLRRDLIAAGFDTIGDLLLFFPRDHISYGKSMNNPKITYCYAFQSWPREKPPFDYSLKGCHSQAAVECRFAIAA